MPTPKDPPLTPRPQRTVQAGDSPSSQHTPLKRSTRAGNALQTRIRDDLGFINNDDMFLQDVKLFLKDYAPCKVTSDQVDNCIERLVAQPKPVLEQVPTQGGQTLKLNWLPFEFYPDQYRGKTGHEDKAFKPLETIFDAILQQKNPLNPIHFELCPRTNIDGDLPGGNHLIDGCFMREPYDGKHLCHRDIDIAVELKKYRTVADRDECHHQIIGACHHILSEDPRRMWIFGITIENNWMSVWCFSRSHSVKTFAFDWFENIEFVIQIVLSFALATPAELGFDPLVHKGPLSDDGQTWSYIYEVPSSATGGSPRFYKTGQIRMPERPMCIAGRVTRIWEVVEVTDRYGTETVFHAETCILKDVWLDENTDTEAENMDKIFASVDKFIAAGLETEMEEERKKNPNSEGEPATDDELMTRVINNEKRFKCFNDDTKRRLHGYLMDKKYRSLFLTKRHAWKGVVSRALGEDVFHCPTLFSKAPVKRQLEHTYTQRSGQPTSESHHRDSYQPPEMEILTRQPKELASKVQILSGRRFVPKQQSRFVYDEVCTRIDRLPTLGDVADVLSGAVDALHILFLAGWVHRDISIGNILAIDMKSATAAGSSQWKVKLSDLEFARVMVDTERVPRSDPRTGTPFFMPTEILRRRYRFQDYRIGIVTAKAQSKFEKRIAGGAQAVQTAPTADVTLSGQVKKATQHEYPHLKAFEPMPFEIEGMLDATDLDPSKIPSRSAVVNHNFQHDLESIWWMLLWFITQGINNEELSDWTEALFQHNVDNYQDRFIALDNRINSHLQHHLPEVLVEALLPDLMEALRKSMHKYYILRPIYGQLDDPESYSEIHALFAEFLYDYKLDRGALWRDLSLKHSGTFGLMKLPGSGAATKRGRTRSMSRAAGRSKKPKHI